MSTNYPTTIDTPTNPAGTDGLSTVSHSAQHDFENDAIVALETKVGINGSAVTTTIDYKLSEVTDKAVGKTAVQTLTNKTLTAPKINVGSDATGDMYYRNGAGVLTRLPAGTDGQIVQYVSGIPTVVSNPNTTNADTTTKGLVEIATTAEITAGTGTGSTGATVVVPASAVGAPGASKLVQYDGTGKLPAVDGSQLTGVTATDVQIFTASGTWTKPAGAKTVEVIVVGAGGGGCGDRGGPAGVISGQAAGGGGEVALGTFNASVLNSTETITVGVGGTGGAGATATVNAGTDGGLSSFGTWIKAGGGGKGNNSGGVDGGAGGSLVNITQYNGGAGADHPSSPGLAGIQGSSSWYGCGGGGSGGGNNTTLAGGAGGTTLATGIGGGSGRNNSVSQKGYGGEGGTGGTGHSGSAGGNATNGGIPGGGGGGGGAGFSGFVGGNGGDGGRGEVRIYTYF